MSADIVYCRAQDAAGLPLAVSVFADRAHVRAQIREDCESAGLRIGLAGDVAALLEGEPRPLGDVVMLDCPRPGIAQLAALSRVDMRAARSGAHLIVSTTVDALDDVFACLDQSEPQILVNPGRTDRVIALGQVLSRLSGGRVREMGEEDRLMLFRLTEQVGRIAERLDRFMQPEQTDIVSDGKAAFRFESPDTAGQPADGEGSRHEPQGQLPLPDPKLVRRVIRQRQLRARFFESGLFADPAWDILLDLTAARVEGVRVSVSSLCIASAVPPTTALRWIGQMTDSGLLQRIEDESDRRRAFIELTDKAVAAMARYFAELGDEVAVFA